MKDRLTRELMAIRVAQLFDEGDLVNLGIGMPTLVANYLPKEKVIIIQSENGLIGIGPFPEPSDQDLQLINAGNQLVTLIPGASLVNHADSFGIIRGGHLDYTILGGMQVSERGDLANWMLPDRGIGSIGGAADLAVGAKHCIVMMEHTTRDGAPKIVKSCDYPLTAAGCVEMIMTDVALIKVTSQGLVLEELAPDWTLEEVQSLTEPRLLASPSIRRMEFPGWGVR